MKTLQAITAAIGNLFTSNQQSLSLITEYATPTRESLAYDYAMMACQRTQQLLTLGRGNVKADIENSKQDSYFSMRALRDAYEKLLSKPGNSFSPVELRAYLAMIAHTGGCQEYAAVGYCYLKAISGIDQTFTITRNVYRYPSDPDNNHVFIQINIAEKDAITSKYLICDPWSGYVGDIAGAKSMSLLTNPKIDGLEKGLSAAEIYANGSVQRNEQVGRDIFHILATSPGQVAQLTARIRQTKESIIHLKTREIINSDRGIFIGQALPACSIEVIPDPSTITIPEIEKPISSSTAAILKTMPPSQIVKETAAAEATATPAASPAASPAAAASNSAALIPTPPMPTAAVTDTAQTTTLSLRS